ncbi:MAG TPA: hypothetical protein VIH52_00290 [Candidatus Nanoarchaeia archaeon]
MITVFSGLVISPTISNLVPQTETPNVSAPTTALENKNLMVDTVVAKKDDRAEKLASYFATKNSPFVPYAEDFVAISDKYDLDWTLLPSIAGLESSFGLQVPFLSFNPYGWNNGKYRFQSWVQATEVVAAGIRSRYAPSGEVTPFRIGRMYAESPTWAVRVSRYQAEILRFAAE